MKKLSKATLEALRAFHNALGTDAEDARNYYEERSEKWKEGDKGATYLAWVESLEAACDTLDELQPAPDEG